MKKNFFLSVIHKMAWNVTLCAGLVAATGIMVSCSKSDDDLNSYLDGESNKFDAYWGKDLSYLQGVWVKETEKDDPSAGYTQINSDGTFTSVMMIDSNRSRSGNIGQMTGDVKMLIFMDSWGHWRQDVHAEWANENHTRLKTYYDGMDPKLYTVYWVKIDKIPANWVK